MLNNNIQSLNGLWYWRPVADTQSEEKVSIGKAEDTLIFCGELNTPNIGEGTIAKKNNTIVDPNLVFISFF